MTINKMGVIKFLYNLKELFEKYSFEIVFILSILFIILYAIYRKVKGEKGTWSNSYYYDNSLFDNKRKENHGRNSFESKGEKECRRVLQKIFNKPFDKARPDFLNNPVTGGNFNLELDCFDEELGIAVEYSGSQHYNYIPYFHKNKEAFHNQKYRDELKRRMCKDNGILLIEVPYTVKINEIEGFIKNELNKKLSFR